MSLLMGIGWVRKLGTKSGGREGRVKSPMLAMNAPHAAYVLQYNMGTIPKMHYNKSGMTPCPTKVAIRTFGWGKMT